MFFRNRFHTLDLENITSLPVQMFYVFSKL